VTCRRPEDISDAARSRLENLEISPKERTPRRTASGSVHARADNVRKRRQCRANRARNNRTLIKQKPKCQSARRETLSCWQRRHVKISCLVDDTRPNADETRASERRPSRLRAASPLSLFLIYSLFSLFSLIDRSRYRHRRCLLAPSPPLNIASLFACSLVRRRRIERAIIARRKHEILSRSVEPRRG